MISSLFLEDHLTREYIENIIEENELVLNDFSQALCTLLPIWAIETIFVIWSLLSIKIFQMHGTFLSQDFFGFQ